MAEIINNLKKDGVLITSFIDQFGNLWMSTDTNFKGSGGVIEPKFVIKSYGNVCIESLETGLVRTIAITDTSEPSTWQSRKTADADGEVSA